MNTGLLRNGAFHSIADFGLRNRSKRTAGLMGLSWRLFPQVDMKNHKSIGPVFQEMKLCNLVSSFVNSLTFLGPCKSY